MANYKPMSLAQKSRLKSQLASKGLYYTDSQLEAIHNRNQARLAGQASAPEGYEAQFERIRDKRHDPVAEQFPTESFKPDDGSWGDSVLDFIGGSLWGALDTASMGLAGAAWKYADEDMYQDYMEDWQSSKLGRAGQTLGSLAGFMVPMTGVAKATGLATRGLRGLAQRGAVKAGKKVATPTTRTMQREAAEHILKASEKAAGRTGGTALTRKEAVEIAKASTEDFVGFAQKGLAKKMFGRGPAYSMEHSVQFVNQARQNMAISLPDILAKNLSKMGAPQLGRKEMLKLTDDVIESVGRQPFNQIERMFHTKYQGNVAQALSNITGSIAQEAVNFGIVGTAMDYVQWKAGNFDLEDQTFGDRALHHLWMGGIFGGVKFIPGGSKESMLKQLAFAAGKSTAAINRAVKKMDTDDVKAFAKLTMKNDDTTMYIVNGSKVTYDNLRRNRGLTSKNDIAALRKAIVNDNIEKLSTFRKGLPGEIGRDMIGSFGRMATGAVAFNLESLNSGAFNLLAPEEMVFHLGIGAIMTKHHRPLYRTGKESKMGIHFSERDYYYNSKLAAIKQSLDKQAIDTQHIGEIVKQFDGNLYTDYANKKPMADVENMIKVLEENDIIYDAKKGRVDPNNLKLNTLTNKDLFSLISPIGDILKSRDLSFNPNASKKSMEKALTSIQGLKSEQLSTADAPFLLNSRTNIIKSIISSGSEHWSVMRNNLFDNFRQQVGIMMGNADYVSKDGRMKDYHLDSSNLKDGTSKATIRKLDEVKEQLLAMDLIKIEDFSMDKSKGIPTELTDTKVAEIQRVQDKFESDWGKEFYGEHMNMPIDMKDPVMWLQFRQVSYLQDVTRINDIIMGRPTKNIKDADSKKILSLINETLSHKNNKDYNFVVENPNKIKFDLDEWGGTAEEFLALQNFAKDLWQINVANGRTPTDSRDVKVDINKVKVLHDALVKQGLPDNILHRLDSRLQTWVDKAIQYGIDNATRGLDLHPHTAKAVKGLMMNGIIHQAEGQEGRGLRLMAPTEITKDQIRAIKPGASEKEIQDYITSYGRVMDLVNRDGNIIALRDNVGMGKLSEQQLSSILTAERVLNLEKLNKDYDNVANEFKDRILKIDDEYDVMETTRDEALSLGKDSEVKDIQAMMDGNRKRKEEIVALITSFNNGFSGKDLSRASAHLDLTSRMVDKNGKNIFTLLDEFITSPESEWESRTQQIKDLQIEIANKVSERADVTTLWGERVQEETLRLKHQEVEGHMPLEETSITPDKFFEQHKINIDDVIDSGPSKGLTHDSASDVLKTLYDEKVYTQGGNVNKFTDRLYELAGRNRGNASNKLRNEVMHISALFERRFRVKKLGVDTSSGSGFFERSEISKGYLTDLYSEVFHGSGVEMTILSPDYIQGNMRRSIATNEQGLNEISHVLAGSDFIAALSEGSVSNMKYMKEGTSYKISDNKSDNFENIDMNHQVIKGKHYVIGVDENINMVLHQSQFDPLATSFMKWYQKVKDDPYVKKAIKEYEGADTLFKNLEDYAAKLEAARSTVKVEGVERTIYDFNKFMEARDRISGDQYMEDAMFTMFNVMYGERADADWLGDAYFDANSARKSYKYKRLAQNQGYSRNSREKRDILAAAYKGTKDKYHKKLIRDYDQKEDVNVFIVDDSVVSETGADVNGLLTDARSVVEANLEAQFKRGDIDEATRDAMKEQIRNSNSINAEQVNAMTAVRREFLDYLLLLEGKADMIGESSGQKPVGLTSFTDASGRKHVFYNKTHYFYDSRLNPFFKKNKEIDQVAFKSGAKKSKVINPKTLKNEFVPLKPPKIGEFDSLESWINTIETGKADAHVFNARFEEMLSGSIYGKAHDAKIMKQFDNWTDKDTAMDIYEWARADLAEQFAEVNIELYNPEDTHRASAEAKSFIRGESNKDGTMSTDAPNASVASIWLEADGVAFSEISKNLYDSLVKRRYVDKSGVFDGYTDAGGVPVLRGNLSHDLNIPVYKDGSQIKLGEANISESYLDRKINFRADFGHMAGAAAGKKQRPKYKSKGTVSIAFAHEGRDILVDIKRLDVHDPLNEKATLADFKEIKKQVDKIRGELKLKDGIATWKDLHVRLQSSDYTGAQLALMSMPAPRTGPHDAMVVKVKNLIDAKDGGIMELNSWDVTMRGQRDYDTDKLPFYMDTPWSAVKESVRKNGTISEALPTDPASKFVGEVDMFNNQSYKTYNQKIQQYSRLRGPIVKMHRKLSYAARIFKDIDGLELPDGTKLKFTGNPQDAMQRLVNDSQNVLDIYNGLDTMLENIFDWEDRTLFNSSNKTGRANIDDNPFFHIESTTGSKGVIDQRAHKLIVKKVLGDFSRLLQLEGDVWETGEARPAKYTDMATQYRDFIREYRSDRVNWNFYNYLVKNKMQDVADQMFFNGDAKAKKAKMINPIFNNLADAVNEHPTPFMKSLKAIADRDYMRVRETYNPKGQSFNQQIDKLIGASRQEALEIFRYTDVMDDSYFDRKNNLISEMWEGFKANRSHEEMMTQINYIEGNIRRLENLLSAEQRKGKPDEAYLEIQQENILIQRESLQAMMDKLSLDPNLLGQNIRRYSGKEGANNKVSNAYKDIVIRNAKTGEVKRRIAPGNEYTLEKGEVAIDNPVVLKAVVEHELIDGVAMAQSALGYYSHIKEADLVDFAKIVKETQAEIKSSVSDLMDVKGVRDWSTHQSNAQAAIDKGLKRIIKLADENADVDAMSDPNVVGSFLGKMPTGRETYGVDFLMALLVPNNRANPNEHFFSPKTGGFMPAVNAPKRSVINAVFGAMETYGVHGNHKEFIQRFAQVHRGFYDTIVSGRGWLSGMNRLATTNFEGALLKKTIDNVSHNPFMPREEFKSLQEYFDNMPIMKSEYAEMYRQVLQEGALIDPATAFRLKRKIIEDPALGEEAYNNLFTMTRGEILFDGLSSKQYGVHKGEGQLVGEILMDNKALFNRNLHGEKPAAKGESINDATNIVIGRQNEIDNIKCD